MQAAGMLRDTGAIYCLLLLAPLIGYTYSHPLQFLPNIPGYIPVYIRNGDQPLEEINPALAEAFHETSSLAKNIGLDQSPGRDAFDYDKINSVIDSREREYYPKLTKAQENSSFDKQWKGEKEEGREEEEERGSDAVEYTKEGNSDNTMLPTKIVFQLYDKDDDDDDDDRRRKEAEKKVMPDTKKKATLISKESTIKLTRISPHRRESPKEETESQLGHRDSSEDFVSVINVESFTDSPNVVRLYKDVEHSSGKQKVAAEEERQEEEDESIVKVQHPSKLWFNVQKLPPIPLSETESNATEGSQVSSTQSNVEISSTELPTVRNVKDLSYLSSESSATNETSMSEGNSSNVQKILPIGRLSDTYESSNETKTAEMVEVPNETVTILYKDLSHLSDSNGDTSKNSSEQEEVVKEKNDEEPPEKVLSSFLDVPSNVHKVAPEIQEDGEEKKKDSISSSIAAEGVGSKEDDAGEKRDDVST